MDSNSIHLDLIVLQNQISALNSIVSRLCDAVDVLGDCECGSNRMLHFLIQILVHECDLSDFQQQLILHKPLSFDDSDWGCPCE